MTTINPFVHFANKREIDLYITKSAMRLARLANLPDARSAWEFMLYLQRNQRIDDDEIYYDIPDAAPPRFVTIFNKYREHMTPINVKEYIPIADKPPQCALDHARTTTDMVKFRRGILRTDHTALVVNGDFAYSTETLRSGTGVCW